MKLGYKACLEDQPAQRVPWVERDYQAIRAVQGIQECLVILVKLVLRAKMATQEPRGALGFKAYVAHLVKLVLRARMGTRVFKVFKV